MRNKFDSNSILNRQTGKNRYKFKYCDGLAISILYKEIIDAFNRSILDIIIIKMQKVAICLAL